LRNKTSHKVAVILLENSDIDQDFNTVTVAVMQIWIWLSKDWHYYAGSGSATFLMEKDLDPELNYPKFTVPIRYN
jgi:hypothetical protein